LVRDRAAGCCEYCRLPEEFTDEPFWIDHVIAEQHGGPTIIDNLAFCCARCNRHKGPNLAGIDPTSGAAVFLFNPRRDTWSMHFTWSGAVLVGNTPTGRATVAALNINHPRRRDVRMALMLEGRFPDRHD
jgi:hypothetical protein